MIIYFHCIFRLFSVFAGLFLIIAFVIQSQGDNICIWRISSILNIPVAFISACSPKYIGTYFYERSIPRKLNELHLIYCKTIYFVIILSDSTLWISWSITMSSLHLFLLAVFFIQILRGISAEADFTYFPEEEDSSYFSAIKNSKYNIFKYDDGKEFTVILIILLWIKLSNYARSPRYYNEMK